MHLDLFKKRFKHHKKQLDQVSAIIDTPIPELNELFKELGGYSFEKGAFRIHNFDSAQKWTQLIYESFPEYQNKIIAFSFEWSGIQFARAIHEQITYVFDIATSDVLELEQPLQEFFDKELVEYTNDTLDIKSFQKWNSSNIDLKFDEIVGYNIPLWLGGKDHSSNYDLIDAEVNWEINRQLMST